MGADPADEAQPGFMLPLLLFAGFRAFIDEVHAELARQGHPDLRPAHGFALQAVGGAGVTAGELGRRLGVSKQAAGKTVDRLAGLGYVERVDDPVDARRKHVRLTARGHDVLARSAAVMESVRARWADALGGERLRDLERGLRTVVPGDHFRLDASTWFGA
ncbi:MarR family winged helix-turn-helix transcriptional regulator [Saccharothrix longispora]|uniref:MarR family winged helix-turn-helix transcriptional regulator n=1 Tax=Saccharothrix longispora TaxID=33920 RepID=UPI0028FD5261|nr:MarR family winged helix-turn-helix transcriptional regulator [Saccharothrix longispora]MBY8851910.1 MarR family winged helix-turn-helix transcriptional regulator [Saccharothrix sp. MB29]MDU0287965.1 MarR family winged helix-turn-helix transcriptional regulator [Saccharothrix longispora]